MEQCAIRHALLILILTVVHPCTGQQVLLKTTSTRFAPALKSPVRGQVVKAVQETLDAYAAAITLVDEASGQVSKASVNKFRALFGGMARLVQDYEEQVPAETVEVPTYCDNVLARMAEQGVQAKLSNATLEKIMDEGAFWVAVVRVEKDFYNYVTADNRVVTIGGRVQHQEIRFDILKNDVSQAKIAEISKRTPVQRPQNKGKSHVEERLAAKGRQR